MQVQNAAADAGQAISATAAGGSNALLPTTPPAPPAGTICNRAGEPGCCRRGPRASSGHFHGFLADLGDATLASISEPHDRLDRLHEPHAHVRTGRQHPGDGDADPRDVSIGGLPDLMSAPTGWTGYLLQLTGYHDTVAIDGRDDGAAPTATINAGSLAYWNGTGYTTVNLATTPGYNLSGLLLDRTALVGVHVVEVKPTAPSVAMGSVPATTTSTTGCTTAFPTCKTAAQSTIGFAHLRQPDVRGPGRSVKVVNLASI